MKPERWQRIEQLYHAALESHADQRTAFLAEACADDELRHEVEALLAANEKAEGFLDRHALEVEAKEIAANRISEQAESLAIQRFSHYQILSKLGAGGMGEIYLARDTSLERRVAIKVLPAYFTEDANRLRRFAREAKAASALNHPNIITIYEIGHAQTESSLIHFIAIEYVEGITMRQRLDEGLLPLGEALDAAVQIAAALDAAHKVGIIHRDIKPENLMLRPDGVIKILDFGLAKLVQPRRETSGDGLGSQALTLAQTQQTESGVVMGTPRYMSPEQARGWKVDERADIFSLGVVLYEMIAGRRPFEGKTKMDVLAAILNQEPSPFTHHPSDETAPLDKVQRIISKALSKEPDDRYQTALDLLVDLQALRQEIEFQQKVGRSQPSGIRGEQTLSVDAVRTIEPDRTMTTNPASYDARTRSGIELIFSEIKLHRKGVAAALTVLALALAAGGYGLYHLVKLSRQTKSFQDIKFSRLTSSGNVARIPAPAISPNGQYAAYAVDEGKQQSLWMKQVATGSTIQIVPPADVAYDGLTFSPDNNYIYYAVGDGKSSSALHRVPALGGAPVRILANIDTAITFSPDGARFAFAGGIYSTLMLVDADGKDVQKLITREDEQLLVMLAWSPDGKTIACAERSTKANDTGLIAVNVEDGTEKPIGPRRWGIVSGIGWLADGGGLIITASEKGSVNHQLWSVSFPDGEARRMSNDLSNYFGVSLSADATRLISARQDSVINLWIVPGGDAARAYQITSENGSNDGLSGIAWTPDGRIVYSSSTSGGMDLWIADSDGGNRRQLTFNAGKNYFPTVSADGRHIVFVSDRATIPGLWRIGIDGDNLKRLTDDSGIASKPESLPNRSQVVFQFRRDQRRWLWRLPIEGGDPTPLTGVSAELPVASPDGKLIACNYGDGTPDSPIRLAILSTESGLPIQLLNLPSVIKSPVFRWMPDGHGLAYLDTKDKVVNVWCQTLKGGPPKQLTDFKTDRIYHFAWSRDGKHLACARGRETSDLVLIGNFQ